MIGRYLAASATLALNTVECARRGRLLSWPSRPARFRGSIVCPTARRRGRCC